MARLTGFEPVTPAFGGQYSIQLSYRRSYKHIVILSMTGSIRRVLRLTLLAYPTGRGVYPFWPATKKRRSFRRLSSGAIISLLPIYILIVQGFQWTTKKIASSCASSAA